MIKGASNISTSIRLIDFWNFLELELSNFASLKESGDILFLECCEINIFLLSFEFIQVLEIISNSLESLINFESLSFSNEFDHVFEIKMKDLLYEYFEAQIYLYRNGWFKCNYSILIKYFQPLVNFWMWLHQHIDMFVINMFLIN